MFRVTSGNFNLKISFIFLEIAENPVSFLPYQCVIHITISPLAYFSEILVNNVSISTKTPDLVLNHLNVTDTDNVAKSL